MAEPQPYKLLVLPYKDRCKSLRAEQILYIQSDSHYCKIVSSLGITFLLRCSLQSIQEKIDTIPVTGTKFIRIHDRYLVSLVEVEFDKNVTEIYISNGDILPVSKAYRPNLLEHLEIF